MPTSIDDTPNVEIPAVTRRGWLLGASALAVLFANSKPSEVHAAPATDTWKLGGNASVDTTNFIGPTNSAPLIFKTAGVEHMRVTASGNIGIGNASPTARLLVDGAAGIAIYGRRTATAGTAAAIQGDTSSSAENAVGVLGVVKSTTSGVNASGVRGVNNGTNRDGAGVSGSHAGVGYGVQGTSVKNAGVYGRGITGVYGTGVTGVYGTGNTGVSGGSDNGTGVVGISTTGNGMYGLSGTGTGVYGSSSNETGVYGEGTTGVVGKGLTNGVEGTGTNFGVMGQGATGVFGDAGATGVGVSGVGKIGVSAGGSQYGINAAAPASGLAGYFQCKVAVTGTLSKGGGSFMIDHPLDPANKYLYHSFVESPDMKNIYDGNVTLDANGEVVVTMPNWFEALNMEFRYQLTSIGAPGPNLYIAAKITGNQFKIAGGTAGMEVSWMVTGIRQDAFANANRIPVEETKPSKDRGRYLHPEVFGKPASMSVTAALAPQLAPNTPSSPAKCVPAE